MHEKKKKNFMDIAEKATLIYIKKNLITKN